MTKHFFQLKAVWYITALLGLGLLSLIIFSPSIPKNINLISGDIAPETIVSPRYISFQTKEDKLNTENLRKQRSSLVEPIYSINESINKSIRSSIVNFFTYAKQYRFQIQKKAPSAPTPSLPTQIEFIPKSYWRVITALPDKSFALIEYYTLQVSQEILNKGIKNINPKAIRKDVKASIRILDLGYTIESFISRIIIHYSQPNLVYDDAKTSEFIRKEVESIQPFTTTFKEGEPVIYKGEAVTSKHIEIMTFLNIYGVKANLMTYFGIFLYGFLLFLLLERFLYYFSPNLHSQFSSYFVMFLVPLFVIILARILYDFRDINYISSLRFLIPIPIVTIILSLLLSTRVAMITGIVTSIFISLMYLGDFYLFLFLFFSSFVATFSVSRIYKRTHLIQSGNIIGLFNVVLIISIGILMDVSSVSWYLGNIMVGFVNGFVSSMISFALLPYLESTFNLTTSLSLLEDANLNHPLLKKLMLNAPGTYQHSLMVANLSEAAAEAINADVILARIGAYFHDIGKIKRPLFFSENQFSSENPHASLSPRMSKLIIAAHVKDGIELANAHKLPKILQAFIQQHHGTSLVSFFYSQALHSEEFEDSEESKKEFRYPGPKPQFKEAAILLLADSVEAAVRSLEKPSLPKIENLIDKIFTDKINDDQLNECNISLREIVRIKQTFLSLFRGIYHNRLDYQEEISNIIDQTRLR